MLFPGFFRTFCHPVDRSGGVAGAGVVALDPFHDGQSFWSLEGRLDRPDQMALSVSESGPGDPLWRRSSYRKGFFRQSIGSLWNNFLSSWPGARDPMRSGEAILEEKAPGGMPWAFYGDRGLEGPVFVFNRAPFFPGKVGKGAGARGSGKKERQEKNDDDRHRLMGNLLQRMILRRKETVFGRNMSIRRIG